MLTIVYDPIEGIVYPDGKTQDMVKVALRWIKLQDQTLTIGSELFIQYVRVAIVAGDIDCTDVQIKYKDQVLPLNKDGRIERWPAGFCDYYEDCLSNLM